MVFCIGCFYVCIYIDVSRCVSHPVQPYARLPGSPALLSGISMGPVCFFGSSHYMEMCTTLQRYYGYH